ncbi:MAG TPA: DUF3617 family protein [Rhodanobacteraceae bacterium]|nr:DUF3617 family protein [Rhodanobacteraceae bacterium]
MKTTMHVAMLAGGVGLALMLSGVARAGDGSLMEVTTTIKQSVSGMPAMPSRTMTRKVCSAPGSFDPHALNKLNSQRQCKIANFRKQGDTVTFDQVCTAPMAMTMHGTFRTTGGANFTGSMHASFDAGGGHPMTLDTEYTGKQIGTCNYTPPQTSD